VLSTLTRRGPADRQAPVVVQAADAPEANNSAHSMSNAPNARQYRKVETRRDCAVMGMLMRPVRRNGRLLF